MNKSAHYTDRGKLLLVQPLTSAKGVIENKRTGTNDLKNKAEAWASEGCAPRSSKQRRKCWDNMKQK